MGDSLAARSQKIAAKYVQDGWTVCAASSYGRWGCCTGNGCARARYSIHKHWTCDRSFVPPGGDQPVLTQEAWREGGTRFRSCPPQHPVCTEARCHETTSHPLGDSGDGDAKKSLHPPVYFEFEGDAASMDANRATGVLVLKPANCSHCQCHTVDERLPDIPTSHDSEPAAVCLPPMQRRIRNLRCAEALVLATVNLTGSLYRLHNRVPECAAWFASEPARQNSLSDRAEPINDRVAKLLNPPPTVTTWAPPTREVAAIKLAEHFFDRLMTVQLNKSGIDRTDLIQDGVDCVGYEHLRVKVVAGDLYLYTSGLKTGPKDKFFLVTRRIAALRRLLRALAHARSEFQRGPSFELGICLGDRSISTGKVGLTLVSGLLGAHEHKATSVDGLSLPLNSPLRELRATSHYQLNSSAVGLWRAKYPWCERKDGLVYRGGGGRQAHPLATDAIRVGELAEPVAKVAGAVGSSNWGRNSGSREAAFAQASGIGLILDAADSNFNAVRIPMEDQERFKMILHCAGNFGWADRLATLLKMGNAVVWQANHGGTEWFYPLLEPWVHYVPVDHLFRNLPDVAAWGVTHDRLLQRISENADQFASVVLDEPTPTIYLATLLQRYAGAYTSETVIGDTDMLVTIDTLKTLQQLLYDFWR